MISWPESMVSRSIEVQVFTISCSLFFLSQFYRVSNAVIAPQLLSDLSVDTKGLGLNDHRLEDGGFVDRLKPTKD
jgi:hypothetical protein